MNEVFQQVRPRAARRGATVGKTINPNKSRIRLNDQTIWRIARETESLFKSQTVPYRKRKVLSMIVSLLLRETGLEFSELVNDNRFLKTRADVYALAFPPEEYRSEMFAAYEAKNKIQKILWVAYGKPKPAWQNENLISEFRNAIRRALHFEYTDDELRELFEIALRQP
jgi:hypothetical protein